MNSLQTNFPFSHPAFRFVKVKSIETKSANDKHRIFQCWRIVAPVPKKSITFEQKLHSNMSHVTYFVIKIYLIVWVTHGKYFHFNQFEAADPLLLIPIRSFCRSHYKPTIPINPDLPRRLCKRSLTESNKVPVCVVVSLVQTKCQSQA